MIATPSLREKKNEARESGILAVEKDANEAEKPGSDQI